VLDSPDPSRYVCAFDNRASINLIVFDRRTGERTVFLKVSDERDFQGTFEVLSKLRSLAGDAIPEPICAMVVGRWHVLATKAYRLELLAAKPRLSIRDQCRVVDGVMHKLTELHLRTRGETLRIDDRYLSEVIAPMARRFFDRPGTEEHIEAAFHAHVQALACDGGMAIPGIPQHGDLVAFNTALVDGNKEKIIFIDWDSYGRTRLAALDAVTFLVTFANRYQKGVYDDSRLNRHLAQAAGRYCEAVGLGRGDLVRLFPLCLLHYADLREDFGVGKGREFAYREIKLFFTQQDRFVLA